MTGFVGVSATCILKPASMVVFCDPRGMENVDFWLQIGGIQQLACRAISTSAELFVIRPRVRPL